MVKAPRTALVTGATGFLGSALVALLASRGTNVYALTRSPEKVNDRGGFVRPLRLEMPITSASLSMTLEGIQTETVFHLASYGVYPNEDLPASIFAANISFTNDLLEALAGRGVRRFIYTGSCAEYAPAVPDLLIEEDHAIGVDGLYGAAKAAAGIYGHALAARFSIPFVHLRLFGVYGPGEGPTRLVPFLINRLMTAAEVPLTTGDQNRDFTYVDDMAEALILASGIEGGGAFNVCSGIPRTVRFVGETVAARLGAEPSLLRWGALPYRSYDYPWIVGSNSKFVEATGWRPSVSLEEGIDRSIDCLKSG